jgi:hypothetical protein
MKLKVNSRMNMNKHTTFNEYLKIDLLSDSIITKITTIFIFRKDSNFLVRNKKLIN